MTTDAARLAEALAARLCHDLGSPVSTLAALQGQASAGAAAILAETTHELTLRLRLMSLALGQGDQLGWADLANLLRGAPGAHRLRFDLPEEPGDLPAGRARLAAVATLLGAEALPRGGVVRVSALPGGGFAVLPQGRDSAWPAALLGLLAGGAVAAALTEGPRRVLSPWLWVLAEGEGFAPQLGHGASGEGAAPLLLAPAVG